MSQLDKPFTTKDMYLAAFLCMQGMTLLDSVPGQDAAGPRQFVLVDHEDRDRWVEEWTTSSGDAAVAKKYVKFLSITKKALYGEKKR